MTERYTPQLSGARLAEVLRLIGEIDEFKGHWRKLKEIRPEKLAQLRQVTTIESAASSTRIEGAELSDAEVARVLQGVSVGSFRSRDESEVRGYGDVLQVVFDAWPEIPLSENHIRQLHQMLLSHSEKDVRHRGAYKTQENHIEARHPDGRVEVLFRTATPFETPLRMRELVDETRRALEEREIHPLMVIARFIVVFLAIHPFQDGNGRLSRALTTLLLIKEGYDYVPYSSLERVIEDNKQAYYAALRESQTALRDDPAAFGEWLLFFLRALQAQKQNLAAKLNAEHSLQQLSVSQRAILDVIQREGRVTTTGLSGVLGLPLRTVRHHLAVLAQKRLIQAHGDRRGRTYTPGAARAEELLDVSSPLSIVLMAVLDQGGRISAEGLRSLVDREGFDRGIINAVHGRRLGWLRKDSRTGESVLTSRGTEAGEQLRFQSRLRRNHQ